MTSGSHGKPYANWALLGAACSYAIGADERSSIDKAVLIGAVGIRLEDTLDWLFPGQRRILDEYQISRWQEDEPTKRDEIIELIRGRLSVRK